MINIGIVDDHAIVTNGFKMLINLENDFSVVAEFSNYEETINNLNAHQLDVLIVDILLPDISGIELIKKVASDYPNIQLIAFSMYNNEPYVSEALTNGATAYLSKQSAPTEIIAAIHRVLQGEVYISEAVRDNMKNCITSDHIEGLTEREMQVFTLLAKGFSTKECAFKLDMKASTAHAHKGNLFKKLRISSHRELLKLALVERVLTVEDLTI